VNRKNYKDVIPMIMTRVKTRVGDPGRWLKRSESGRGTASELKSPDSNLPERL
jgi:hypothetical protein